MEPLAKISDLQNFLASRSDNPDNNLGYVGRHKRDFDEEDEDDSEDSEAPEPETRKEKEKEGPQKVIRVYSPEGRLLSDNCPFLQVF